MELIENWHCDEISERPVTAADLERIVAWVRDNHPFTHRSEMTPRLASLVASSLFDPVYLPDQAIYGRPPYQRSASPNFEQCLSEWLENW